MKLAFGGGASEVGASFILLGLDGKTIALDCGVRMSGDATPDFQILNGFSGGVDCILLSHAHMDHSGALPILSREYPNAHIYMTHATNDLTRILLYDSLKIMDQREAEIPIYAEAHVRNMLDRVVCFSPTHAFKPFKDAAVEITFYGAGHIAGAAGIFIAGEEGSFFYSGDFSTTPQRTVEGASFPRLRPDVAVFESTYGDRLHSGREIEEGRLVDKIAAVAAAGGKLLIPAFSLGRAQEIILIINRALNKKQLPPSLKVYVDGMVNDICRAFLKNPNYLRSQYGKRILKGADIFYNENVISVNRNKALREQIAADSGGEGLVVISSSGMLTGGPSQWYAEKFAGDEKNVIALTGYQDEESPGRKLLELAGRPGAQGAVGGMPSDPAELSNMQCDSIQVQPDPAGQSDDRILKIGNKTIPIKCGVEMYGLSAHADKTGILALAHMLAAKRVFLVHGNSDVVNALGSELQKEYDGRVYVPKNGESFDIIIKNKRKQAAAFTRAELERMPPLPPQEGRGTPDYAAGLRRFIIGQYGAQKAFTLEELYYICFGAWPEEPYPTSAAPATAAATDITASATAAADPASTGLTAADSASIAPATDSASVATDPASASIDYACFRTIINNSPCFETELKRPFIYHAAETPDTPVLSGAMEVNAMLALAGDYFPPETGLYKKGARLDEKTALLSFEFPIAAAGAYAQKIVEFERETGWKVELNAECALGAAERLIRSLVGALPGLKISYYRSDNLFQAVADEVPKNSDDICIKFAEITGIALNITVKTAARRPAQADSSIGQMEQNKALALIDARFADKPHKPMKKSLKFKDGAPGIELGFITPIAGKLYEDDISSLMEETRWNMWIGKEANQHSLMQIAATLLGEYGIIYKKLSYIQEKVSVQATLYSNSASASAPTAAASLTTAAESSHALSAADLSTPQTAAASLTTAAENSPASALLSLPAPDWDAIAAEFTALTGAALLVKYS